MPYTTTDTSGAYDDAYGVCKKLGKFKATQRTQGISTTDVVAKVLRKKNSLYARNLKRGDSREKLGMSRFRYYYMKFTMLLCPSAYSTKKND